MELNREAFRESVLKFRSTFKEDALSTAEKSVQLEKRGRVAIIWFDQYQERANKLSTPNLLRLVELLSEVEKDSNLGALVFLSKKPTIFIAGADIAEIKRLNTGEAKVEDLMKLQAIPSYVENLPIPSISAIHGACMGGGTELSLGCDYRMATDAPETRIGLPEVNLGVLPGWGGSQRLPRLVGLEKSLDMLLAGKALDAKKAKKIGLVDRIVAKEWLEASAVAWAEELAKSKKKRTSYAHGGSLRDKLFDTLPGKWLVLDQARKRVMEKTKGHYPAPLKILEVLNKTYGGDLEKGLRVEADAFAELVQTPESKAMIGLYYLTEQVKKDKGTTAGVTGQEVKAAGVLGAGTMGGGIAQLFAAKNIRVRMKDLKWDAITKGYQAAHRVFSKQVERRRMKPNELDGAMARIEGTTTYSGFAHLDVVVEAVVENLDVKKKVFQELEQHVGPKTVLATNTSSLSVTEIARGVTTPSRVVGMHFFNPVDKMPLVEIIRGKETSDEAVATVFALAKRLGKTPIVVGDGAGFVVNRILGPYMYEALHLLSEGVPAPKIDATMEEFGMPMGPLALLDEIGLDVAAKVSKILHHAYGDRMSPPAMMESVTDGERLGKKTGKGLYLYEKGKRLGPDTAYLSTLKFPAIPAIDSDTIRKREVYIMVNEAARILEEGLVRHPSDIDIGMIFGSGFAPFRGGLLRYADSIGMESIVNDLELLARNYGPRFQPAAYLVKLARENKKFYAD